MDSPAFTSLHSYGWMQQAACTMKLTAEESRRGKGGLAASEADAPLNFSELINPAWLEQ